MKTQTRTGPAALAVLAALSIVSVAGTVRAAASNEKDRHLGPTGLFGVPSRSDIKVTRVVKGSPADGKINVGDVIVGAGGATFKDDTRRQLADAIDQAETQVGYEISFTRHFDKPTPMRSLEEIRADLPALQKEGAGLLEEIIGATGGKA